MFDANEREEWQELVKAMDEAPTPVPCQNWPDAFFTTWQEDPEGFRLARASCQVCPIRAQCASYGIRWAEFGIWGGLTAIERKAMRRKLPLTPKRVA